MQEEHVMFSMGSDNSNIEQSSNTRSNNKGAAHAIATAIAQEQHMQ